MSNEVFIKSRPYEWCNATVRVSENTTPGFEGLCTFVFSTGCASAQTYATREELIAMAELFLDMAGKMEPQGMLEAIQQWKDDTGATQ